MEDSNISKKHIESLKKIKNSADLKAYEEITNDNGENLSFIKYSSTDNEYLVFNNRKEEGDCECFFTLNLGQPIPQNLKSKNPQTITIEPNTIQAKVIEGLDEGDSATSNSFGLVLKYKLLKPTEDKNATSASLTKYLKDATSYDERFGFAPKDLELTVVFFWGEFSTKYIYSLPKKGA